MQEWWIWLGWYVIKKGTRLEILGLTRHGGMFGFVDMYFVDMCFLNPALVIPMSYVAKDGFTYIIA